ncbi:hypothetical protein HAX54_033314 [Datura stramonium]|uniref:Late blight resistance protein R1A-like N-terminal domain-containing protein n=1 Tax=Datura stramonium TaxID=4076 RepID=A0ABS8SD92_DATST|nr:hypothetical protein [Datura stramonium]
MVSKKSSDGKTKACRIHDLLLDFCRKKAKVENFLQCVKGDSDMSPSISNQKHSAPLKLCLYLPRIDSEVWKVTDEQFLHLKFLKLQDLSFSEWNVSDDVFPFLEHLALRSLQHLEEIPSRFADMPTLKSIELDLDIREQGSIRRRHLEKQLVSFFVSREDTHLIDTLEEIEREYSSSCVIADKHLSLLYYYLHTLQQAEGSSSIEDRRECDSLNSYLKEYLSLVDGLKFLKRDFKFLDIILNSLIIIDEPDVREMLKFCFKVLQLMSYRSIQSRCIEPQGRQTFFCHALEVAWHTIMLTWLYIPNNIYGYVRSAPGEEYPLFSDVMGSKIQPKMYVDVL